MPRPTRLITGVALLACTACSAATEPEAPALSGEAAVRAASAFAAFSQGPDGFVSSSPSPNGTSATVTCPRGGSFRTTVDAASETLRGSIAFRGCGVADSTGQVWTFTSLPSLAIVVTPTEADSLFTLAGSIIGALRVESAGVLGTCTIDSRLRLEVRRTPPFTERFRQTGQICGQAIDTTWTTTVPAN